MKKLFSFILITILCVLPLSACSTDFSETVGGAMDDLYNSLKEMTEPFLKQDEKYSSDTNTGDTETNKDTDTNAGEAETNTDTNVDTSTDAGGSQEPSEPSVPTGTSVGEKLPSFSVQTFDETGLLDEMIDPTKTGKVTVINFWGLWCHFCLEELPDFSEIAGEYKDYITMVAIHTTDYFASGAVEYVANGYAESEIIFAKDVNLNGDYDGDCYEAFGGIGYYPYTVILDENGVITYKTDGAISKATLRNEIEKALGN